MKKTILKNSLLIMVSVLMTTIGYFVINGIPLAGIPEVAEVSYLEISDSRLEVYTQKITIAEDINKAMGMMHFLKYQWGVVQIGDPIIEITCYLKDGTTVVIAANEETVFWRGKAHAIKDDYGETFVKIIEGVFFSEALDEMEDKLVVFENFSK